MSNEAIARFLGPLMAAHLYWWSEAIFRPAKVSRKLKLHRPLAMGTLPRVKKREGLGPSLSTMYREPVYLREIPEHYPLVEDFDSIAPLYESAVLPFSGPIFSDMLTLLKPYLNTRIRILDPSCGPGTEAIKLAQTFPECEVIAADLSRGMVDYTASRAGDLSLTNMAFFQSDVGDPNPLFENYFDVIFCELSFHHYPDTEAAIKGFKRCLRPDGVLIIGDPGPEWFNRLAKRFSDIADPGFIKHRTGAEFQTLCEAASFSSFFWVESLPGIGISVAQA